MKWKEYNYTAEFSLRDDIVYRPMISMVIRSGAYSHNCFSLIDSGTDSTLINSEFMQLLGIDESKCKKVKVGGVGNSDLYGFISKVKFSIDGFDDTLETEVIFVKDMVTSGLLGQKDIFENFKIRFEKKHRKFYLLKEK